MAKDVHGGDASGVQVHPAQTTELGASNGGRGRTEIMDCGMQAGSIRRMRAVRGIRSGQLRTFQVGMRAVQCAQAGECSQDSGEPRLRGADLLVVRRGGRSGGMAGGERGNRKREAGEGRGIEGRGRRETGPEEKQRGRKDAAGTA